MTTLTINSNFTLNHLIYDIKNIIYGGRQHNNAEISDRQIAFWINQARALFIRQEFSAGKEIPSSYIQQLTVELDQIDTAEDCEVFTNCYILRSVLPIPSTIRRGAKNTIISVQSLNEDYSFSETTFFRKRFNSYNKYTKSKERWYLKNNYLYLTSAKVIEKIKVSGVFEFPEEVSKFATCEGYPCYSIDIDPYPLSLDVATLITDMIIKHKVSPITAEVKKDETNDARDNKERTQ